MAGPYRTFLLDLADHLMKDNVEKMKFLLTDVIPAGKAENLDSAWKLLEALDNCRFISFNNVTPLKDLFDSIGRRDLFSKIDEYDNNVIEIVDIPTKEKMSAYESWDDTFPSECENGSIIESPGSDNAHGGGMSRPPSEGSLPSLPYTAMSTNAASVPLMTPGYFRQKTSPLSTTTPVSSLNGATNGQRTSLKNMTDLPASHRSRPSTNARPEAYCMNKEPRGHAIIYSNRFDNAVRSEHNTLLNPRPGTEKDVEELTSTFKRLKFTVTVYKNLTAENIKGSLQRYAEDEEQEKNDCFIVCILTHGYEGGIYGNSGCALSVRTIRDLFLADKCRCLLNKPKLFFIQACQGEADKKFVKLQPDSGGYISSNFTGDQLEQNTGQAANNYVGEEKVPIDADFMFFMATTPGTVSWRDTENGSWFIQTLCKVFEEYSSSWSLMEMVQEVTKKLSKKSAEVNGTTVVQISSLEYTTIRKNLYFLNTSDTS